MKHFALSFLCMWLFLQPVMAQEAVPARDKPLSMKHLLKSTHPENYHPPMLNRRLYEVESPDWEAPNPRRTKAIRKHVHRNHVANMTPEGRRAYLKHIRKHRRANRERRANNKPERFITDFNFASAQKPPEEKPTSAASSQDTQVTIGRTAKPAANPALTTPSGMTQYEYKLLNYRAELMAWWNSLSESQQATQRASFRERLADVDAKIQTERAKLKAGQ